MKVSPVPMPTMKVGGSVTKMGGSVTKMGGPATSKFGGSHLLRSKSKQLDLMSDADASCYEARYFDITATMDAKKHWATVGKAEGRLGTCAPRLTDTQAFEYLMNSPVLQNKFGR
jgi:hypothetical protein